MHDVERASSVNEMNEVRNHRQMMLCLAAIVNSDSTEKREGEK